MANRRGRADFGSVRKERSGRWSARVPIAGSGGKHRSLGTFETKRQALDRIAKERTALVGGTYIDPARGAVSLAAYAAQFIATNGYRERSRALNERVLAQWVAPRHYVAIGADLLPVELGSRPLRAITGEDVRLWHTAVSAESRRRAVERHNRSTTSPRAANVAIREWAAAHGLTVAPTGRIPAAVRAAWEADGGPARLEVEAPPTAGATEAAQAYRLLHAVLERAVEDGLIQANPARIKGAGAVAYPEVEPVTVQEVLAVADAMPARYRAAVIIAALTSLRSGELFALRRSDYNRKERTVRVERAIELEAAAADFGQVKAGSSLRTVAVPAVAAEALERHLATFTAPGRDALIFTTSTGGLVYADRIGKHLRKARRIAGVPELRWHGLRHAGQSLAARTGAGVKDLQQRAGQSTNTAAARYIHRFENADRRVADAIDALVRAELDEEDSGGAR